MRQVRTQAGYKENFLTHGIQVNTKREEQTLIVTITPESESSSFRTTFVVDWQMQLAEVKEFNDPALAESKSGIFFH